MTKFLSKGYAKVWVSKSRRSRPLRAKDSIPAQKYIRGKAYNPPNPTGQNHSERMKLKARERIAPAFERQTKARFIENFQKDQRRDALKKRIENRKLPKKPKVPFISKRSLKAKKK